MNIRQADSTDLARLAPLAAEFYAASRFLKRFELERFIEFWTVAIEKDFGVVFLLDDDGATIAGTLGGVAHLDTYSGDLVAVEFFWFCAANQRGRGLKLYQSFETWARDRGCVEIRMVHLLDSMPEKLPGVYRRLGFQAVETLYSKELN